MIRLYGDCANAMTAIRPSAIAPILRPILGEMIEPLHAVMFIRKNNRILSHSIHMLTYQALCKACLERRCRAECARADNHLHAPILHSGRLGGAGSRCQPIVLWVVAGRAGRLLPVHVAQAHSAVRTACLYPEAASRSRHKPVATARDRWRVASITSELART